MRAPTPPNNAVVRSVHASTKNSSGHDNPQPKPAEQDDFPGRLRCCARQCASASRSTCSACVLGGLSGFGVVGSFIPRMIPLGTGGTVVGDLRCRRATAVDNIVSG